MALAEAYRSFAQPKDVGKNYARALELSRQLPGGKDSDLTLALEAAHVYFDQTADLQTMERILEKDHRRFGDASRVTADAANALAHRLLVQAQQSIDHAADAARAEQLLHTEWMRRVSPRRRHRADFDLPLRKRAGTDPRLREEICWTRNTLPPMH